MKKVYFISTLFIQRRNFLGKRQTRFSEFKRGSNNCIVVTNIMLVSTYANQHLFAFLLKLFSVLKVSKGALLLYIIGIKEWIRCNLRYTADQKALLVWDSFRGHLMEAVKDLLARRNVDVAVIPGGLTPVLQPLDKCINKPFKNKVPISGLDGERSVYLHSVGEKASAE